MRIHTDCDLDLLAAARKAGVFIFQCERHGSRKRARAYEVSLSGSSPYNSARDQDYKAATWDEWGIFLAELFETDPQLVAGQYDGLADFERQTREVVEANERYEKIVGRKRPGHTGPWLVAA